ncbi:MAG: NAD(P)-binding protein [Planctomycetota bacterium]
MRPSLPSRPNDVEAWRRDPAPLAIVCGYGPVGRLCDQKLTESGFQVSVVERNLETVETRLDLARRCTFGCAADLGVLRAAGLDHARALVVAISSPERALDACRAARAHRPDLFIAVRMPYCSDGLKAREAGADEVIVDEMVTAVAMRDAVARGVRIDWPLAG